MAPSDDSKPRRRWLKGCALGCGLLLLATTLVGVVVYQLIRRTVVEVQRIETVMETLTQRHGSIEEFCPDPSGVIAPQRMEAFLEARELMAPVRAETEQTLKLLSGGARESQPRPRGGVLGRLWDWAVGIRAAEAGTELIPQLVGYIGEQAEALLEAEMGPGEYIHIYVLAYYSWLGESPGDGPAFRLYGHGSDYADEFDVREDRREQLMRRSNTLLLGMLRRQLEALHNTSPEASAWRATLSAEIEAMERDEYRLAWHDGLPPHLEASLAPFEQRLRASYSVLCNPLELIGED